jgi:uncharacterized Fe-S radical SAM superfamily protein PflX
VFPNQLAAMMIRLQEQGCHNINFVTPTHVVPRILQALDIAVDLGLHIPLVYNSSGYESPDTHVNLMSQYRPMGEAVRFSDLCHPLSAAEFRQALEMGKASGLTLVR